MQIVTVLQRMTRWRLLLTRFPRRFIIGRWRSDLSKLPTTATNQYDGQNGAPYDTAEGTGDQLTHNNVRLKLISMQLSSRAECLSDNRGSPLRS